MLNGRYVDLTLTLNESLKGVSFETSQTVERDGWNARTLHIYSHTGTHMDAPLHFGVSEQTIDTYKPDEFIGRAHILRLPVNENSYLITENDLKPVDARLKPGDSLVIQTGWSSHLYEERYWGGLPRLSVEAAEWIVDHGVRMLGVEPPSVADVNNLEEVTRIHQILLRGNVIIIEGLTNLDQIRMDTFYLLAFPMKIADGDGGPARVIACETDD